jgi:hypothetical protein
MAEAAERDLRASKPLGDSENFEGGGGASGEVCRGAGEGHGVSLEEWGRVCVFGE